MGAAHSFRDSLAVVAGNMAAATSGSTEVAGSKEMGIAKNEEDEESIILLIKPR